MRQVGGGDYAPSRIAYRLNRIWLTPALRWLVRVGLPLALLAGAAALWLASDGNAARLSAGAADLRRAVEDRPGFRVGALEVAGGPADLRAEVEGALALELPESSLRLDLPALRAAVLALPRVEAAVLRVAGGTLRAEVTPRAPAILHRDADGLAAYDAEGRRLMTVPSRAARPDLPLIAGAGGADAIPEALAVLDAAGSMAPRLAGLTRIGRRRWDAVLTSGQRILLPERGAPAAMRRAAAMDDGRRLTRRAVTHLDLRLPGAPVIRMTEDAAAALAARRAGIDDEDPSAL